MPLPRHTATASEAEEVPPAMHHYVRAGYQLGDILKTNDFVQGTNATGEPIDLFHSLRAEFGWQTTGSEMWHQIWGSPPFGFGLHAVDYFNEDELGNPHVGYRTRW